MRKRCPNVIAMLCSIAIVTVLYTTIVLVVYGDQTKSQEDEAWAKVDRMDTAALNDFVVAFPESNHLEEAKQFLDMHTKLKSIQSGKKKPVFVIDFKTLGSGWSSRTYDEKGLVTVTKMGSFLTMSGPHIKPFTSGGLGESRYAGGNGSIWAFQTQDEDWLEFFGFSLKSKKDDWLYFGIVKSLGLVYLSGNGKVKMLDGKELVLPPAVPAMAPTQPK